MAISSALEALFKKTEPKAGELLPGSSIFSNRVLVIVGFVALVVAARSFLTEQVVTYTAWLVGGYLASGTLTKLMQTYWNGRIRVRQLELAYADGKLDDNEEKLLSSGIGKA